MESQYALRIPPVYETLLVSGGGDMVHARRRAVAAFVLNFVVCWFVSWTVSVVASIVLLVLLDFLAGRHEWFSHFCSAFLDSLDSDVARLTLVSGVWAVSLFVSFRHAHKAFMDKLPAGCQKAVVVPAYSVSILISLGLVAGCIFLLMWPVRFMADHAHHRLDSAPYAAP